MNSDQSRLVMEFPMIWSYNLMLSEDDKIPWEAYCYFEWGKKGMRVQIWRLRESHFDCNSFEILVWLLRV